MKNVRGNTNHIKKMKTNGTLNDITKTMEQSMLATCVGSLAELGRYFFPNVCLFVCFFLFVCLFEASQ